jgi:hypothetical protein
MVDRKTSMKSSAMRVVWKSDLPLAARVVAKNVRGRPVALSGSDGREGFDIAGAKALLPYVVAFGTMLHVAENSPQVTKSVRARLQSCRKQPL